MKVKIKQAKLIEGERYRMQWAFLEMGEIELPFKVSLGDDNAPYAVGDYRLSGRGFATNDYHKLQLKFVALEKV